MPEQVHEFNIARFRKKIKRLLEKKTKKIVRPQYRRPQERIQPGPGARIARRNTRGCKRESAASGRCTEGNSADSINPRETKMPSSPAENDSPHTEGLEPNPASTSANDGNNKIHETVKKANESLKKMKNEKKAWCDT